MRAPAISKQQGTTGKLRGRRRAERAPDDRVAQDAKQRSPDEPGCVSH
jgi:hypothetical protein